MEYGTGQHIPRFLKIKKSYGWLPLEFVGRNLVEVHCHDLQSKAMGFNDGASANSTWPDVLNVQHMTTVPNLKGKSYIEISTFNTQTLKYS